MSKEFLVTIAFFAAALTCMAVSNVMQPQPAVSTDIMPPPPPFPWPPAPNAPPADPINDPEYVIYPYGVRDLQGNLTHPPGSWRRLR